MGVGRQEWCWLGGSKELSVWWEKDWRAVASQERGRVLWGACVPRVFCDRMSKLRIKCASADFHLHILMGLAPWHANFGPGTSQTVKIGRISKRIWPPPLSRIRPNVSILGNSTKCIVS